MTMGRRTRPPVRRKTTPPPVPRDAIHVFMAGPYKTADARAQALCNFCCNARGHRVHDLPAPDEVQAELERRRTGERE